MPPQASENTESDKTMGDQNQTATLQEHQHALYVLLQEFDRVCKKLNIPYFLFAGSLLGAVRHRDFIPWDDDLDVVLLRRDYERFFREAPAVLDREKFFLQQEFTDHWPMFFSKLRLNNTTCLEKYHPRDKACHQGVYMDIFPCDQGFNSAPLRKLQFYCSKVVIAKGLYSRGYDNLNGKKKLFMAVCRCLPRAPFLRIVKGPKKQTGYLHSFLGAASKFSRSVYPAACFEKTELLPFRDGLYPAPGDYDRLLTILYGDYMVLPPEEERKSKEHAFLVDLTCSWEQYKDYRDGMTFDTFTRSIR